MLSARLIRSDSTLNNIREISSIDFTPGDIIGIAIRLLDPDTGERFVPPANQRPRLKISDINGVTQSFKGRPISLQDTSMWLFPDIDTTNLSGGNISIDIINEATLTVSLPTDSPVQFILPEGGLFEYTIALSIVKNIDDGSTENANVFIDLNEFPATTGSPAEWSIDFDAIVAGDTITFANLPNDDAGDPRDDVIFTYSTDTPVENEFNTLEQLAELIEGNATLNGLFTVQTNLNGDGSTIESLTLISTVIGLADINIISSNPNGLDISFIDGVSPLALPANTVEITPIIGATSDALTVNNIDPDAILTRGIDVNFLISREILTHVDPDTGENFFSGIGTSAILGSPTLSIFPIPRAGSTQVDSLTIDTVVAGIPSSLVIRVPGETPDEDVTIPVTADTAFLDTQAEFHQSITLFNALSRNLDGDC